MNVGILCVRHHCVVRQALPIPLPFPNIFMRPPCQGPGQSVAATKSGASYGMNGSSNGALQCPFMGMFVKAEQS